MRAIRRFTVRTVLPEPLAPLADLAMNLRWSWHPATRELFASIDPTLWAEVEQDPSAMLGQVPGSRWNELAADASVVARVREIRADLDAYLAADRWFQHLGPEAPRAIAYFSPEFGVAHALPQYSGGLGILAGDHLKAASDLGVPIIGVGLFYRAGYFRQSLSADGWQQEYYPVLDPDGMAVTLLRDHQGRQVLISVAMPGGRTLHARVWQAQVGRVPLLLLDSDVESNELGERDVTDKLYGGGGEHRLRQEMLLGIGGVRAVRAYCRMTGHAEPEVFHTNEGHAGFLGIERISELITHSGRTWESALEAVRASTVFTTHTPVPAGIDRFPRDLISAYFGADATLPGIPVDRLLALGSETYDGGDPAVFNMAVMGLRLAGRANGVSLLHGDVSRGMFQGLWSGFDQNEVPIGSITNGVHAPTWVAPVMGELIGQHGGWIDVPEGWQAAHAISDADLWSVKRQMREALVEDVRARLRRSWRHRGAAEAELSWIDGVLDPDILTIGFARRVPSYKRLTLMLRDPARLKALLLDPERPVQLIIAGKSHPADDGGKRLIQQMVQFADDPDVRHRIVFLPDYDMGMASLLYPGCDVWLNNPLRPLEACGTSGMKAALNGALNLSILDGWWDEWFDGTNGWAIPSADGIDDQNRRDDIEAHALYDLLAGPVTATFYARDSHGLPTRWIGRIRHTLATLGPKVLASRMVRDYVADLYAPAAASWRAVAADGFAAADALAVWKARVRAHWPAVQVEHVESHGVSDAVSLGQHMTVRAFVSLGSLAVDDVEVHVLAGRVTADDVLVRPQVTPMLHHESFEGGRHRFEATLNLHESGPFGYTVRVVPRHEHLSFSADFALQAVPHTIGT